MGEKRNAYRLLVVKPEGKKPLERRSRKWVDNIKIDILEISWGGVDCIDLAQDRNRWRALVNSVMNLSDFIKCWETIRWLHNCWPVE
jgi:ribosome biogenesis protein Tsr3